MIKNLRNLPNAIKFMFFMVGVYLLLAIFDLPQTLANLQNFWRTLISLVPILLLVFSVIFLVNLFLKPEVIKRHLGHDSGLKGWFYASIASIFIVSPPYVIFPLLGELKAHGMKYSLIAVFLSNRNVSPAFLPVTAYYFGLPFTVIISCYILLFSVFAGLVMGQVMGNTRN